MKSVALDANWRWLHNGQYTNCHLDHFNMAKAIFPKGIRFAQHHETYGGLDPQQKPEDFGWFGLYIEDSLE